MLSYTKLPVNVNDTDGVIAEKVDLLFEKRKAVRESALKALHATLSLRYCGEALDSRQETVAEGLERVLRDQQPEPTILALRTASLVALSIPSGHHALFTKLNDPLLKIIANESLADNTRSEAIHTLATTCFISGLFDVDHEFAISSGTLRVLLDLLSLDNETVTAGVIRAAAQGVMLLGSTIPASTIHKDTDYFAKLLEFMEDNYDISVRIAAAKAAVTFVEWEKDRLKEGGVTEIDLDEVIDKTNAILADKSKFRNKVEIKKQRSVLKSIIDYLGGGPMEEETIMVRNYALTLKTWTQIFRMERFRGCLGEGFMNHLEENKNLMYMFDYYVDTKAPVVALMTKQERRMSLTEASKIATKARCSLRAIREEAVGYATN